MKIAVVVSTFPPNIGGMGAVAYEEAVRLRDSNHEVHIFALDYASEYHEVLSVDRLTGMPRMGDGGFVPTMLWKLRGFDVIHFHYPFYGAGLTVLLARWLFKVPLVVTYHMDAQTKGLKKIFQTLADWLVSPLLFKMAKKVITPDLDYFYQAKFAKIAANKVVELPNGVAMDVFSPGEPDWSVLSLPVDWKNKKIMLFVGNLLPIKRLDVLLDAMALKNDPDEVLVVVGGGYDAENMRAKVKEKGLFGRTMFVGRIVNQREMVHYYRAARVVVIPSDVESFSLVALEAMASAKAVIASAIPGLRRRVQEGKTGYLFTPGSAESLRKQLDAFFGLTEPEQLTLGLAGRALVEHNHTWDAHVHALEQSYR